MDDREEALADLGHALARVVTAAMADLPAKPCQMVVEAINAGEAKMQLLIDFEPFTVAGFLKSSDATAAPVALFQVVQPPTLN